MKLTAKHNGLTFEIEDDLPDLGWMVYVYDSEGKNTHDYLQDDLEMAQRCARDEFGVPYDAWTTDDEVQCCLCGRNLNYNSSFRILIEFGSRPVSRTLFSHKDCFMNKIHHSVKIPNDLTTD